MASAQQFLQRFKVGLEEAAGKVPTPDGKRVALVFKHGSLLVEFYIPKGLDPQQPHRRDEVYIVASGSGTYRHGDERMAFTTGDFLFAEAGTAHCFENFSDDFAAWVMFYGPEGGEK